MAFRFCPTSTGQNFGGEWAESRLIPRVKMEVSGDPFLQTRWGKFRLSGTRLGRSRGWLRTIHPQPRNVLPNGEDILRISCGPGHGHEHGQRVAEGPRATLCTLRIFLGERGCLLFSRLGRRAFPYVPIPLRPCARARGGYFVMVFDFLTARDRSPTKESSEEQFNLLYFTFFWQFCEN